MGYVINHILSIPDFINWHWLHNGTIKLIIFSAKQNIPTDIGMVMAKRYFDDSPTSRIREVLELKKNLDSRG